MAEQLVFNFDEIWKPIPGYEGYEASNQGRVRSVDRQIWCGTHWRRYKGRILRPTPNERGYGMVHVGENRQIHALVMLAFVGPCPKGMQVCHYHGDPTNNRLGNLRYDTPKGNHADTIRHGRTTRGSKHKGAKLTVEQVRAIRLSDASSRVLAAVYGVSDSTIQFIKARKRWAWVIDDDENPDQT